MKTKNALLIVAAIVVGFQLAARADSFTYVFVPQNDPGKIDFDKYLASATVTLTSDTGTFVGANVSFTTYPGVQIDAMELDLEGNATPTALNISLGRITAFSKTFFANDEQIRDDAVMDGSWVIQTAVPATPDATGTLALLGISFAGLIFGRQFRFFQFTVCR